MKKELTYLVSGMTCGHCANSISEEVSAVDGVTNVDVDLETKNVTVAGDDFEDNAVRIAIAEAGYSVDDQ